MAGVSLVCLIPLAFLINSFLAGTALAAHTGVLIAIAVGYVIVAGFFVSAVCGYMAGLIGSSNSPISGVGILVVLGIALLLAALHRPSGDPNSTTALVAYALFTTAVVFPDWLPGPEER